ncbi:hypothetical protein ABZP36_001819 [Zizania latifolia]
MPDQEDPESGYYPMVLVQILMCNEKEVYQQSIAAVCNLDWPRSNFLVQVLADSDDPTTQALIKEEVEKWQQNGAHIVYRHRVLKEGYKAGNLKSAMSCSYVKDYEYVSIFDADFQPYPDFLKRTVPHFKLPDWVVCYIPALMSFLNIVPAPKSFPFIIPYLLFESIMSVTKFNAMISGLFQLGSAYEWVVTKKSGRSSEGDLIALAPKDLEQHKACSTPILDLAAIKEQSKPKQSSPRKEAKKKYNRIYKKELALSLLLLTAAAHSLLSKQGIHFYFLLFQGLSFLLVGLDLIGEDVK